MRFFLAGRRPLPLLKLLENLSVRIYYGDDRFAKTFPDERLKFILNLRLLLLQVVRVEDWSLVLI